jgi:hypothetical protein
MYKINLTQVIIFLGLSKNQLLYYLLKLITFESNFRKGYETIRLHFYRHWLICFDDGV